VSRSEHARARRVLVPRTFSPAFSGGFGRSGYREPDGSSSSHQSRLDLLRVPGCSTPLEILESDWPAAGPRAEKKRRVVFPSLTTDGLWRSPDIVARLTGATLASAARARRTDGIARSRRRNAIYAREGRETRPGLSRDLSRHQACRRKRSRSSVFRVPIFTPRDSTLVPKRRERRWRRVSRTPRPWSGSRA
jgi:hypothetical protein